MAEKNRTFKNITNSRQNAAEVPVDEEYYPFKVLGLAVVATAMYDVKKFKGYNADRRAAVRFFRNKNSHLSLWCDVADLDAQAVRERAEQIISGKAIDKTQEAVVKS